MLAQQAHDVELVAICDPGLLEQRAALLSLPFRYREFNPGEPPAATPAGELRVLPVALTTACQCGVLDSNNAEYVLKTLDKAAHGCKSGNFAAMVTGPVHKGIINDAGIVFSGHTEYLAEATHADDVVMLLATDKLRVALATTHLPLSQVSETITEDLLLRVTRILHAGLQQQFGIEQPRISICGLNPHAGEGGHLGREEIEIIAPALERLRKEGMDITGPLPADTAFIQQQIENCDAILAMYHDQGLPVLKHTGFGRAVNITLGLPIIRTSVDHGTALALAGTGKADPGSIEAALACAINMASNNKRRAQ